MEPAPVVDIGSETIVGPKLFTLEGGSWQPIFENVNDAVANWTVHNRDGIDVYLAYLGKEKVAAGQVPQNAITLDPFGEESRDEDTRQLWAWVAPGLTAHLEVTIQYRYNAQRTVRTGQRGF